MRYLASVCPDLIVGSEIINCAKENLIFFMVALLFIFDFLGPLGLDPGRLMTPFRKCVFSNFSKKTNNPNPSPITKTWFGLSLSGAPDRT